ncbi:MAG: Gfo/Idh/MocA family oxidoreductase [Bacteroidales bacterium]|nr:Gfo/Idh/MocA family oxidoreductase [Bacteroidales bacterium]
MKKKYNWGILGAGNIARKFASDLKLLPAAKLYAVGSRSLERAESFASEFSVQKAYGTYEDFISDPEIDIVYIASRHIGHYPDTLLCLNHGKPVLCEKPIAMNRHQFRKMRALAESKRLFFMEALWTRFIPSFLKTMELIRDGAIGEVRLIESDFCFCPPYQEEGRLFNPELGGGTLLDVGIYPLFIALELGGDIKEIQAMANFGKTGVDTMCHMLARHTGGVMSVLSCSIVNQGNVETIVQGTKGRIRLNKWWHTPTSIDLIDANDRVEHIEFDEPGFGYQYEAQEVMDCLDQNLIQSSKFSLAQSDRLITALDRVRELAGIKYPQRLEKV